LEIASEFHQSQLVFVLTITGYWNRILKDRRGRTDELQVTPRQNLAGIGPRQEYKLRMRGGEAHRIVKVEVEDRLLSESIVTTNRDEAELRQLPISSESRRIVIRNNLSPALECAAHQVLQCPMVGSARRLFLEGKALEMLSYQLQYISDTGHSKYVPPDSTELECLQNARSILEKEYPDPPSLFGLARRVGLNDFKLKRGFREAFGTTVFSYVRELRMDKARSLLEQGELSVTEVALETGYSSLGHFAAAFRKRFGILPSQCRSGRQTP
ncbi:helix-turn-helix transcriptional regulator, partial [Thermodesulfobacteriota bacterium]